MPVQDLTPQLRTRLSRVERAVGWFVMLATVLLIAAFAYYIYHTAQRKGWFLTKLPYHTFVQSAAGLHVGDPVMLMGFDIGQITRITAMPPFSDYGNVYVQFIVREPFYGYIWTDSYVKLVSAGFLGSRTLEIVQGGTSGSHDLKPSYQIDNKTGKVLAQWNPAGSNWVSLFPNSKGYGFTNAQESQVVTERLEELANQAQKALPGILDLTNQVSRVLSNVAQLTARADHVILQAEPLVANFSVISSSLTNGAGSLGDWLIPTNMNRQLTATLTTADATLATANTTLASANTNVTMVALSLDKTLVNLANITSNLNQQVQSNDQILGQVSAAVVHADQLMEGLKHHWLLRSAFKGEPPVSAPRTNSVPPPSVPVPNRPVPAGPREGKR